jgi:hypothetical protein
MPKPYIAFAVDLSGAALAHQELVATDDQSARDEARSVLTEYDIIEVWHEHRLIGRVRRREQLSRS